MVKRKRQRQRLQSEPNILVLDLEMDFFSVNFLCLLSSRLLLFVDLMSFTPFLVFVDDDVFLGANGVALLLGMSKR